MKIKTISSTNKEDLDLEYNTFEAKNKVKFSQSHVNNVGSGLVYTIVIFYE